MGQCEGSTLAGGWIILMKGIGSSAILTGTIFAGGLADNPLVQ